jgi:glycine/D-amino acid oxidase-like deaminating enzyme
VEREYIGANADVSGAAGSTWLARAAEQRPPITTDVTADVLVVGAGIVGALVAFELASRGLSVALLERRRIAGGTTGHSTAKITVLHDTDWSACIGRRGFSAALAEWAVLNAATPSAIEDLARSRRIECGLRMTESHLVAATASDDLAVVREMEALRHLGVGVDDLGRVPGAPLGGHHCIRATGQAQFDPAAFTLGLVDSLPPGQVTVAEGSPVRGLVREGGVWRAHLDHGSVRATQAVMTSLAPVRDPALLFTRFYPYCAYAYEFVPADPPPDGFWIQIGGDNITLRPRDEKEGSWIAAGEHVRQAAEPDERAIYARLVRAVESHFPGSRPVRHWSTEDLWTPDGLPFVGRVGPRRGLYVICGFGGWGMSASLPAARLVADAITGSPNAPVLKLLSPDRVPGLRAMPTFLRENSIVARRFVAPTHQQKHADAGVEAVAEGAVPPRCTHLHCRLKVDTAEGTLDCPCHGSRFTGAGDALYGPARSDLKHSSAPEKG